MIYRMPSYELIDGNFLKNKLLNEMKQKIETLIINKPYLPGLAVILVGDNPASKTYINMKKKACKEIGINSFEYKLQIDDNEEKLIDLINNLNNDNSVNGILLQLPLPKHYNEQKMLELISPAKDVDGFHPINVGKLLLGLPTFKSCTPYGVCELLTNYNIKTEGKHIVIIGRSNIVGKPLAAMLMQKSDPGNATVTVCHSRSNNISSITNKADILIAAVGIPYFVKSDMVKQNAVVIDVGINRVDDINSNKKYKLVGDVDFENVKEKSSYITPVPGGVGPLTISMLMKNTIQAYEEQNTTI